MINNADYPIDADETGNIELPGFQDSFSVIDLLFGGDVPLKFPLLFDKNDIRVLFNQRIYAMEGTPDLVATESVPENAGDLNFDTVLGGYDNFGNMIGVEAFADIGAFSTDRSSVYGFTIMIDLSSVQFEPITP